MQPCVVLFGSSKSERLAPEEIDALFDWSFEMHDHSAVRPQRAIFWHRDDNSFYWKFVN